jgi:hypothetical protein
LATGDHDWTAGETVTAANMDDYLQLQAVQQFATAAARDAALTARKREGMVTYQLDTNTLTVYSGAAWSTIGPTNGALTTWTPAIVQSGSVTCTVTSAWYARQGRLVYGQYFLTCTGAGTVSNLVTVSLPVTATAVAGTGEVLGSAAIFDASTGFNYPSLAIKASTTTMKFALMAESVAPRYFGSVFPTVALAASDTLTASFQFEAAGDA